MTKSVIMIAYSFPPEGSAGAFRPLRFVRQLIKEGWKVGVISSERTNYERHDPGLLSQVPEGVGVVRVRVRDPWQALQAKRVRLTEEKATRSLEIAARINAAHHAPLRSRARAWVRAAEAWCYHPDMAMPWIAPAVEATVKVCADQRPDVIWVTAGPVSSFAVAQRASRKSGVPYVLDFRDAWTITYNEFENLRPKWAQQADRRRMYQALEGAQSVVFLYETMAECFWRAYPGALDPSRIHIIPNGYEGAVEEFNSGKGNRCTLLYSGTVSDYRYDTFLRSVQVLQNSSPNLAAKLRIHFVGECMETLANDVAALGLSGIVEARGRVSHSEVTRLQREADLLLVLGRNPRMKGYELFAGAKLFGYLKAGRPIVGVLPSDETQKILRRVGVSTIANVDSVDEITAELGRVVNAWASGTLASLVPDPVACGHFSAERQTAALVLALEGSPPAEPFVPGRANVPPSLREELAERFSKGPLPKRRAGPLIARCLRSRNN